MASVWYCRREDVKSALGSVETARNNAQIDRAIEAASRGIERDEMCARTFYPQAATREFTWPDQGYDSDGTLFLGEDEVISVTSVTTEGTAISSSDYALQPVNSGPPYSMLVLDADALAAGDVEFEVDEDTGKGLIEIVGVFGGNDDEETVGELSASLAASESATASISWSTARFGVGDVLRIDSERMIVTERTMVDSTQDTQGSLTAAPNDVTVAVTTGSAFAVDQVLLIDSERMLVVDVAGNNLTVRRAWDGSVLAAHNSGASIYTLTGVTVDRAQLGTTLAVHNSAATIHRLVIPPLVRQLCVAESINSVQQEMSGYSRTIRSGDGQSDVGGVGLPDLRRQVLEAHGRGLLV